MSKWFSRPLGLPYTADHPVPGRGGPKRQEASATRRGYTDRVPPTRKQGRLPGVLSCEWSRFPVSLFWHSTRNRPSARQVCESASQVTAHGTDAIHPIPALFRAKVRGASPWRRTTITPAQARYVGWPCSWSHRVVRAGAATRPPPAQPLPAGRAAADGGTACRCRCCLSGWAGTLDGLRDGPGGGALAYEGGRGCCGGRSSRRQRPS